MHVRFKETLHLNALYKLLTFKRKKKTKNFQKVSGKKQCINKVFVVMF